MIIVDELGSRKELSLDLFFRLTIPTNSSCSINPAPAKSRSIWRCRTCVQRRRAAVGTPAKKSGPDPEHSDRAAHALQVDSLFVAVVSISIGLFDAKVVFVLGRSLGFRLAGDGPLPAD